MQRPALISCRRQRTMDRSWRPCSADVACRCPTGLILRLRLLSYELTGSSVMSIRESQTCRPRPTTRLGHHAAFHGIHAVAPCFVHKSVHKPRRPINVTGSVADRGRSTPVGVVWKPDPVSTGSIFGRRWQRRREAEARRDELRVLAEQQASLRRVATASVVEVYAQVANRHLRLEVRDDGIGGAARGNGAQD